MNANCLLTYNVEELTSRMTEDRVLRSEDKRHRESDVAGSGGEGDAGVKDLDGDGAGKNSFTPLYSVSEWSETFTPRKCLSVAIDLPSDTHDDYDLAVVENGNCLQLRVCLPSYGEYKDASPLMVSCRGWTASEPGSFKNWWFRESFAGEETVSERESSLNDRDLPAISSGNGSEP